LGEREVELGPPLRRCLFSVLAMQPSRAVPLNEVITALWGDAAPATAAGSVHTYVAGLRRALEPDPELRRGAQGWLRSEELGYRLVLNPAQVDAHRFKELYREGQRLARLDRLAEASAEFAAATRLWQGIPFHGVPGPFAEAERARLTNVYLAVTEERARVLLELRAVNATLTNDLISLIAQHPLRESLREVVMLVLYRLGRQADALQTFHDTRRTLARELGVRPGAALQDLYERMLVNDPSLDAPRDDSQPSVAVSTAAVPAQLPHRVQNFVSRVTEASAMESWATRGDQTSPRDRVLAVQGTAGVGKTALTVHVAHRLADRYPDGQIYLDLGGFGPRHPPVSPTQALTQMLNSLEQGKGSPDTDQAVLTDSYRGRVAGKRILIVLDNAASVQQVTALLPGTPSCLVMVTSQNQLADLALTTETHLLTLDVLEPADGVTLLANIAGTDRVEAEPAAASRIVELCARLPLALRIAAARTVQNPALRLSDMADDLADTRTRLDMLEVADDHTSAVRSVFSRSYQVLGQADARTFRMLSLHPTATFSVQAAAAMTGQSPADTRRHLDVLANAHLITISAEDRVHFHDLLRLYAAEQSAATDARLDRAEASRRLLDWYGQGAGIAARELPGKFFLPPIGPPDPALGRGTAKSRESALHWFDVELLNLLAATKWAFDIGEYERAWKIPLTMATALFIGRRWDEWITCLEFAIQAAQKLSARATEIELRAHLAFARIGRGDYAHAAALFAVVSAWADSADDQHLKALGVCGLIAVYVHMGQPHKALQIAKPFLPALQSDRDWWNLSLVLSSIGMIHKDTGNHTEAAAYFTRVVELCADKADPMLAAFALLNLAEIHRGRGDFDTARKNLETAESYTRTAGGMLPEIEGLKAFLSAPATNNAATG
jgi:DNA-binding SARP family transcriptional activator/tetratricopeptide (TPR) repeat protein